MISARPSLIVFVLTYWVPCAQPSLGLGKTNPYETECKNLRMGQFMCPDPAYEFIDPETQQLRGCTKDNVAQGCLTLYLFVRFLNYFFLCHYINYSFIRLF